jgi:hypothetical protein
VRAHFRIASRKQASTYPRATRSDVVPIERVRRRSLDARSSRNAEVGPQVLVDGVGERAQRVDRPLADRCRAAVILDGR